MQNIPPELIATVENYIYITSFKMKGSPDLGQADKVQTMYIRPHYLSGAKIYHFHIDVYTYVAIDVTKADTSGI